MAGTGNPFAPVVLVNDGDTSNGLLERLELDVHEARRTNERAAVVLDHPNPPYNSRRILNHCVVPFTLCLSSLHARTAKVLRDRHLRKPWHKSRDYLLTSKRCHLDRELVICSELHD